MSILDFIFGKKRPLIEVSPTASRTTCDVSSPTLPDHAWVQQKRNENSTTDAIYAGLLAQATTAILGWTTAAGADRTPWSRVSTIDREAAKRLIQTLRDAGYAADTHWHSSEETTVVQFALYEHDVKQQERWKGRRP